METHPFSKRHDAAQAGHTVQIRFFNEDNFPFLDADAMVS
tara:strand:- start:3586 stop:3705 length:120 start_codon:yes stop_codon:yes gene_type:complete